MKLEVEVVEVKGKCPVHEPGDKFELIEGYRLQHPRGKPICMHALASFMPFYNAMAKGVKPEKMGLAGKEPGKLFFQCMDPVHYTDGGTAVFRVTKVLE